jgi:hypothetical protein
MTNCITLLVRQKLHAYPSNREKKEKDKTIKNIKKKKSQPPP